VKVGFIPPPVFNGSFVRRVPPVTVADILPRASTRLVELILSGQVCSPILPIVRRYPHLRFFLLRGPDGFPLSSLLCPSTWSPCSQRGLVLSPFITASHFDDPA